jgi:hypothetical protein
MPSSEGIPNYLIFFTQLFQIPEQKKEKDNDPVTRHALAIAQ